MANPNVMIAYDPQKDAIYDLEHGIEKILHFHDGLGNVAVNEQTGEPLRLFQMWNAGATGTRNITPAHPQYVMGEMVDMLVAINMTRSGHMKPRDMRLVVAGQFALGLGQFLTKRGLHVRVQTRKLGEVELIEIKKKFTDGQ